MKELVSFRHGQGTGRRRLLDELNEIRHVDGKDDFSESVRGENVCGEAGIRSETLTYEDIPDEVGAVVSANSCLARRFT